MHGHNEIDDETRIALARHVLAEAREAEYEDRTPDDVDVDWDDWSISGLFFDDGVVEVEAKQDDYQTKGGRFDYKVYEGTIRLHARADWREYPLAGEFETRIEWQGGKPSPPAPNVDEHRYDL